MKLIQPVSALRYCPLPGFCFGICSIVTMSLAHFVLEQQANPIQWEVVKEKGDALSADGAEPKVLEYRARRLRGFSDFSQPSRTFLQSQSREVCYIVLSSTSLAGRRYVVRVLLCCFHLFVSNCGVMLSDRFAVRCRLWLSKHSTRLDLRSTRMPYTTLNCTWIFHRSLQEKYLAATSTSLIGIW